MKPVMDRDRGLPGQGGQGQPRRQASPTVSARTETPFVALCRTQVAGALAALDQVLSSLGHRHRRRHLFIPRGLFGLVVLAIYMFVVAAAVMVVVAVVAALLAWAALWGLAGAVASRRAAVGGASRRAGRPTARGSRSGSA